MNSNRRQFLIASGAAALTGLTALGRARLAHARGGFYSDSTLEALCKQALLAAKKAGASYADVRVVRRGDEGLTVRDTHLERSMARESYGLGMRVLANGAWGFAATSQVNAEAAAKIAGLAVDMARANAKVLRRPVELAPEAVHVDVWQTPMQKDPFRISLAEKAEYFLAVNGAALKSGAAKYCQSGYQGMREWKLFASSEGAYLEQVTTRVMPHFSVTAVDQAKGGFQERAHELPPMQAGWEYIEGSTLLADAPRLAEDARERLKSPTVTPGKKDLILAPSNLWLTIHESIGHSTELDRALGYEANLAGTSFATLDKLGKLQLGSGIVNVYADKTTPGGLATCGYDDDGVKTQRWDLVKNGVFVGYQTTREQAHWLKEPASRGTCYAMDYKSFPFQRMPNVSLAPAAQKRGQAEIVAATDDGVLIVGNGSWSIDHQRKNFQFGGQMFYEIKKGKITHALRDVAYQANTVDFWNSCDMLGGPESWELHGAFYDGKGEPMQMNPVSHGCPPARFKGVNILNANPRGA